MQIPQDLNEAKAVQLRLRRKIKITPLKKKPAFIAGVDAAFSKDHIIGVACLYRYPELVSVEDAYAAMKIPFPYIPNFLSFREGNVLIRAIKKLKVKPDLILFDGQGIAHPAGIGIASHIGVLLKAPAIGCAKSKLIGEHSQPGRKKGRHVWLKYRGKTVGAALTTREGIKPVFVSSGHMITLKEAIHYVLGCTGKFRIPEPIRRADQMSKALKKVDNYLSLTVHS